MEPPPAAVRVARPVGRATLAVTLCALAMMIVFAGRVQLQAPGSRSGRRVELVELIQAEQARNAQLARQIEEVRARLTAVHQAHATGDDALRGLTGRVDETAIVAGLTAVKGPGLEVILSDSTLRSSPSGDYNDLVIHEQDLQAVINALWAGGAEAMSVNGQRILATTAIRCVGNTLLLHGRVYSPPYEIVVIGAPAALAAALDRDPAVMRFRAAVARFGLAFEVASSERVPVPAYEGGVSLRVAKTTSGEGGESK